jgi:uncharacterized tellurite resistance protein B-like protein
MFSGILNALKGPEPVPLPEPDTKLALGALLVRVALSDARYRVEEIGRIDRLLARMNDLNPVEAAKMRATCEKLEKQAPGTEDFAHLIRETVRFEARIDALEAMWEVVLADGVRREEEVAVITSAQEVLGLSQSDSDAARLRAETEMKPG